MTSIEWTHETWNPLIAVDRATGKRGWFCTKVSPGCTNCYAEKINQRLGNGHLYRVGYLRKIEWQLANLDKPLKWKRPRMVFVNSMTDLFHENVPDGFVSLVFAAMAAARQHTFQVLTKRPLRMEGLLNSEEFRGNTELHWMERFADDRGLVDGITWPLPNVWLGTSVEDQERADERIPTLLETPAAVRFLSCEPLLGPIDFTPPKWRGTNVNVNDWLQFLDWVIVGGESGIGARAFNIEWAREIVNACHRRTDMGRPWWMPCFVKQLGAKPFQHKSSSTHIEQPGISLHIEALEITTRLTLNDSKGGNPDEWPADLRVREFPQVRA